MRYLESTHGVSVAWLHGIFQAAHVALVYEITSKMAADIYTKGYDDARKWKSVTSNINIVTNEFIRSLQALELSRTTNDLSWKLPAMSDGGAPYFARATTPILPPELCAPGGSGKPGWREHEKGRFLVAKDPKMMRTAEAGLLQSSWFLQGGKWLQVEDHFDPSDKTISRFIPDYVERGVFQFHTPVNAAPSRTITATASFPSSDGLLSLKPAVGRHCPATSTVSRFDLPPSIVDQLDTVEFVAVGGWGRRAIFEMSSRCLP